MASYVLAQCQEPHVLCDRIHAEKRALFASGTLAMFLPNDSLIYSQVHLQLPLISDLRCVEVQGATYLLNVVVSKKHRKRGIGRALMAAAGSLAKDQWGSSSMCTHVSAQNEARLFTSLLLVICSGAQPYPCRLSHEGCAARRSQQSETP